MDISVKLNSAPPGPPGRIPISTSDSLQYRFYPIYTKGPIALENTDRYSLHRYDVHSRQTVTRKNNTRYLLDSPRKGRLDLAQASYAHTRLQLRDPGPCGPDPSQRAESFLAHHDGSLRDRGPVRGGFPPFEDIPFRQERSRCALSSSATSQRIEGGGGLAGPHFKKAAAILACVIDPQLFAGICRGRRRTLDTGFIARKYRVVGMRHFYFEVTLYYGHLFERLT